MSFGYLTAAYAKPLYLEQAVSLVLSFRLRGDTTPFSLVTDPNLNRIIEKKGYAKWFHRVIVLDNDRLYQFVGKLHSAVHTPYADTIYFDSDCLLVSESRQVKAELSQKPFGVTGDSRTTGLYAGLWLETWLATQGLNYLPVFNAGVFRYNTEGMEVVKQAIEITGQPEKYRLPRADGGLNEQTALAIAMSLRGLHPVESTKDVHYSFFNADSPLHLNLQQGHCHFVKEGILRKPLVFHYTPLFRAGYYRSRSRKVLAKQLTWLRKQYGLPPGGLANPGLRDLAALTRNGRLWHDPR